MSTEGDPDVGSRQITLKKKRNRNVNYISATAGEEWHLRATQLLGADRWREQ